MNTSTRMHEYYLSSLASSYHEHKHTYAWILFIILDEFLTWTQAHVCMNIMYHPWRVPNMNNKHTYAWILFIILDEFLTWTQAHVCMNIIYHPWRVPTWTQAHVCMNIIYHPWRVPNMNTSTRMHEWFIISSYEHKHTYAWILFIILDEFLTWTQAHVCMNIIYHPWRVPNMNTSTRMHEYYLSSLMSF